MSLQFTRHFANNTVIRQIVAVIFWNLVLVSWFSVWLANRSVAFWMFKGLFCIFKEFLARPNNFYFVALQSAPECSVKNERVLRSRARAKCSVAWSAFFCQVTAPYCIPFTLFSKNFWYLTEYRTYMRINALARAYARTDHQFSLWTASAASCVLCGLWMLLALTFRCLSQ